MIRHLSNFLIAACFAWFYANCATRILLKSEDFVIFGYFPIVWLFAFAAVSSWSNLIWNVSKTNHSVGNAQLGIYFILRSVFSILFFAFFDSINRTSYSSFLIIILCSGLVFLMISDLVARKLLIKTILVEFSESDLRDIRTDRVSIGLFITFNLVFLFWNLSISSINRNIEAADAVEMANSSNESSRSGNPKIVLSCKTKSYHIKISDTGNSRYLFQAWSIRGRSVAPSLKLVSSDRKYEGSGVCTTVYYKFRNGAYLYSIGGEGGCGGDSQEDFMPWLQIKKEDKIILEEICRT